MKNFYYTPPSDSIFDEMKAVCIQVWQKYKESPGGYMEEKVSRIRDIKNIEDNFMYMLAMFDSSNQKEVIARLSDDARQAIRERMIAGGNPPHYLALIGL